MQGSFEYLKNIRNAGVTCPLLCKEFIVAAYQISLARAKCVPRPWCSDFFDCGQLFSCPRARCGKFVTPCVCGCSGADAILLIASVLPNKDLQLLIKTAQSFGMQCLIEVRQLPLLRV